MEGRKIDSIPGQPICIDYDAEQLLRKMLDAYRLDVHTEAELVALFFTEARRLWSCVVFLIIVQLAQ